MNSPSPVSTPEAAAFFIRNAVDAFVRGAANDMDMPEGPEPAFGAPLVGIASGADPLWNDYKTHVGTFHWTPFEAFRLAFPEQSVSAGELFVISWILPQTGATRQDQRKESLLPAERWIRARVVGEREVNNGLRKHLVGVLAEEGIQAAAPVLLGEWAQVDSERFVYASNWSERHAAYAAGLGTFGLCDGLITPVGKSMRAGSVVARVSLPVSERPYSSHREYCLFFNSGGICGKCIKRCPVGALSPKGHDKRLCNGYAYGVSAPYAKDKFGLAGDSCGLCQVGVPCESGIPKAPKAKAHAPHCKA